MGVPVWALTALTFASAPGTGPWYERPACRDAAATVMRVELDAAKKKFEALDRGDLEDRACAVWTRAMLAETELAVGGKRPELLEARRKSLFALFSFAKKNRRVPHLADLAIEARVRRVRVLLDDGEKKRAFDETRGAAKMLEGRKGASNPTLDYARGVTNTALSQSGMGLRLLSSVAGFAGDADAGRKALTALAEGNSVYWSDAQYVRHFFSVDSPAPENGRPVELMKRLVEAFPTNPQLASEYANDLYAEKRYAEALAFIAPLTQRLDRHPSLWSNHMRAKLYWVSGRCAAKLGKKDEAARWAKQADAQRSDTMSEKIEDLLAEIG